MGTVDRSAWPVWVRLGLWGLPNRVSAWFFFWLSVGVAVGCVVAGFWYWPLFFGAGMAGAAVWYFASIRWVDENSSWA
jgi:hypothetical protein